MLHYFSIDPYPVALFEAIALFLDQWKHGLYLAKNSFFVPKQCQTMSIISISGRIHTNPACIFQVVMAVIVVIDQNLILYQKFHYSTHTRIGRHVALFEAVALFFRSPATFSHSLFEGVALLK
jgi:hypothetical protein